MRKKFSTILFCLLATIACLFGMVACDNSGDSAAPDTPTTGTEESSKEIFHVANGVIYGLTDYGKTLSKIEIPDEIDGEEIVSINEQAFYGCTNLTSVTIGNNVLYIGSSAFSGCPLLSSVTIGKSVISIGGVALISEGAFNSCNKLVEVINKSSLPIKKGSWNYGYVALYALTVHDGESKIVDKNGYLFITDNGTNYLFDYTGTETNLVLPNDFDGESYHIYEKAFYNCRGLTSVMIPNSVTSIGNQAFYNCSGLTSVTIGNSVTSIGADVFEYCTSLQYNEYGNAYYLGNEQNKYLYLIKAKSTDITSCAISNDCEFICDSAFKNCGLKSVTIPNSVTTIGNSAFEYCSNLTSVYYKGIAFEWRYISISQSNNHLTIATRYYYSESKPTTTGNYWRYVDGVPTPWEN